MNMTDQPLLPQLLLLLMILGKFSDRSTAAGHRSDDEVKQSIFNFRLRLCSPMIVENVSRLLTVTDIIHREYSAFELCCQLSQFNCPLSDEGKQPRNDEMHRSELVQLTSERHLK